MKRLSHSTFFLFTQMRKNLGVLCFLLAVLTFVSDAQFQQPKQAGKTQRHHTQVRLLAEVESIQPGVPFAVGVLMAMDKGWHTYWKNPGESGLPTTIEWKLPKGFSAGEIQWPLPHKYNESGDVLTYGYADENMLLVQITPPTNLQLNSTVPLKADVSWLECEKLCVPGNASVELKLPVAANSEKANVELFEKYRSQIPAALATDKLDLQSETKNGTVVIGLSMKDGARFVIKQGELPDFYPEPIDALTIGRTGVVAMPTEATMTIPLSALEKTAGPFTLHGVIVYQLDGEQNKAGTVEIPLSKEFVATIPIEGDASNAPQGSLLDQTFSSIEREQAQQPLYLYLFFAVVGGLLLNIMPCVLPVISLKIFGLMKMAGDKPIEVKKSGWFFSLGILASFLALAVVVIVLKSAGSLVGWGFQFQEPLFVLAMTTVVFAFGLSLFGVYEISVPPFLMKGATKTDEKKGFLAPFSEGIFATILATPCTAPILGTALGFAFSQPAATILLIFAATAFGMALPYLILTAQPKWMKFLPKPGEWMVTAKQFMGFLMMATAIWLLYILGKQLGMEAVVWTVAFLLVVGVSCWMIGRFATLTATRGRYFATWGAALLLGIVGYNFFVGDVMKAKELLLGATHENANTTTSEDGIAWQPFTLDRLESHLKENKSVFIDFTAEWCLTCKVNEKTVLADKDVVNALKQANIVTMKADWTNRNETITRLLQKFGRSGVPLYVLFHAGKPTEPIVLPEVITPTIVIEAVKKAR
jgi:thiol:disulfide interchange protein DsbD